MVSPPTQYRRQKRAVGDVGGKQACSGSQREPREGRIRAEGAQSEAAVRSSWVGHHGGRLRPEGMAVKSELGSEA